MGKDIEKIEWVDITKVKEWLGNPKTFSKEAVLALAEKIKTHGFKSAVVVWRKNSVVYKGNTTLRAAKLLGLKKIPVTYTDFENEDSAIAYGIADNQQSDLAEWDIPALTTLLTNKEIYKNNTGFTESSIKKYQAFIDRVRNNKYTKKIPIPIYSPKNTKPKILELFNSDKTRNLIAEIKKSKVTEAEKEFLINAARRHVVFNYGLIADYYSHSNKEMQYLMEKSALVIIDFNKAIEEGYVKIAEEIANQYTEDITNE